MNTWLRSFAESLQAATPLDLERDEMVAVLDLAGSAARGSGARQFAPLAAYLAGRAAAAAGADERVALLRRAGAAAAEAGPATEPLEVD